MHKIENEQVLMHCCRFIIRDTVEHEHFIRNYFDEQKKAEEMIGMILSQYYYNNYY